MSAEFSGHDLNMDIFQHAYIGNDSYFDRDVLFLSGYRNMLSLMLNFDCKNMLHTGGVRYYTHLR